MVLLMIGKLLVNIPKNGIFSGFHEQTVLDREGWGSLIGEPRPSGLRHGLCEGRKFSDQLKTLERTVAAVYPCTFTVLILPA
jgi:hypothetical protein